MNDNIERNDLDNSLFRTLSVGLAISTYAYAESIENQSSINWYIPTAERGITRLSERQCYPADNQNMNQPCQVEFSEDVRAFLESQGILDDAVQSMELISTALRTDQYKTVWFDDPDSGNRSLFIEWCTSIPFLDAQEKIANALRSWSGSGNRVARRKICHDVLIQE